MQYTEDQQPFVSLIVSTLGRDKKLEFLFQNLIQQEYKNFEVIVVDQNDDDRLIPIVNPARWPYPITHVSAAGQRGLSRGRNVGLAHDKGDIVLFPDDDCWYPPWFLQKGVNLLKEHACSSVSGRSVDEKTGRSINGRFERKPCWVGVNNIWTTQIEWVVFFKRDAINSVNGYDENIGIGSPTPWQACEGQDITLRLLKAGHKIFYDPSLYGFHADISSSCPSESTIVKGRGYARGLGYVLRRHDFGLLALAYWLIRPIIRSLIALAKGNCSQSKYYANVALGRLEGWRGKLF